ncbi:single-strand selective monofunctional uracil DNA glycosylase-like [Diadema setosum]|uniref:single-strand selective monofunctional uracil DNA glycosylase-like n=1 Tax=Diadema setosum TaxID=31175 RepID=UPI003B3B3D43
MPRKAKRVKLSAPAGDDRAVDNGGAQDDTVPGALPDGDKGSVQPVMQPPTQPAKSVTQSSSDGQIAEDFISLMEEMIRELDALKFGDPVSYIYNPLVYAKETHDCYIRKYGNSKKSVLFLGMNPGPFGMAQNGVPFGETTFVKDWMEITGKVGKPPKEHPKRIIEGLECTRSEVSGSRFWSLWKDLCKTPDAFFRECFVYNHCPLVFMTETSKNITPPSLKADVRKPLIDICDDYLCKLIKLYGVKVVVGIGKFAEDQTKKALKKAGMEGVTVVTIMHPSPINPATNKGWDGIIKKSLKELDLMKYFE